MGGNAVPITYSSEARHGSADELHGYWDSGAGLWEDSDDPKVNLDLSSAEGLAFIRAESLKVTKQVPISSFNASLIEDVDFSAWANESYWLARNIAYADMNNTWPSKKSPYVITLAYQTEVRKVILERVALGGYRLGAILKQVLEPNGPNDKPPFEEPKDKTGAGIVAYIVVTTTALAGCLAFIVWKHIIQPARKSAGASAGEQSALISPKQNIYF
jgi:hypothetical protein